MLQIKGFTLIEILVVIGLISAISVLAVPYSIRQITDNRAYEAASELSSVIFNTQQNAYSYKDNKSYGVEVKSSEYTIFSSVDEDINQNLVGYWKMNEPSWTGLTSGEVVNSANNYYHGSAVSGATTSDSPYQFGGQFNGTNSWVNLGDITQLNNGASQFTVSTWVMQTNVTRSEGVFHKATDGNNDISLAPFYTSGQQRIYAEVGNGSNSFGYWNAAGVVQNNTWYHLAMVYNGGLTNNSNRLKLYVNGVPRTLTFSGTIPASTANLSTRDTAVGAALNSGVASNWLSGKIDELRVYNVALSDTDIQNLYKYNSRTINAVEYDLPLNLVTDIVSQNKVIVFEEAGFRPNFGTSFNVVYGGSEVAVEVNSEGLINYYIN